MKFCKPQPCANCPYRTDAPLAHWSIEEFKDLLKNDADYMGVVYECHKKDGKACTGFVINQRERDLPSVQLRIFLITTKVPREELEALNSPAPLYNTITEMCKANYPQQFKKLKQ